SRLAYRRRKIQSHKSSSIAAIAPSDTPAAATPVTTLPAVEAALATALGGSWTPTCCSSVPVPILSTTCSRDDATGWTTCSPRGTMGSTVCSVENPTRLPSSSIARPRRNARYMAHGTLLESRAERERQVGGGAGFAPPSGWG